jgi:ubiquinone/menaquinone biosynthesis C-methylase UbiE
VRDIAKGLRHCRQDEQFSTEPLRAVGGHLGMGFYQDRIVPHLVRLSMRNEMLVPYRRRIVPAAEGRVLELGIGSGVNLPLYSTGVREVIGFDPSAKLLDMARGAARPLARLIELVEGSAETIPLEDASVDSVVSTWTLCSIPDVARALAEVRRVLNPSGHFLFVEHGRSPDASVRRWQDRLTPIWKRLAGGCHLNRAIPQLLQDSGFQIEHLETGYMRGPKTMTFMYEGHARPR